MRDYISTYVSQLDTGRLDAVLATLNDLRTTGVIRTREEFDKELERLLEDIVDGWTRSFQPKLPSIDTPVISSEDFNDNFRSIHTDLAGLFRQVSRLGSTVTAHERLMTSELREARTAVRKLLEDAAIFRFLKEYGHLWNEVKYNTFAIPRNFSDESWPADVDIKTSVLTLPPAGAVNLTEKRGNVGTTIDITSLSTGESKGMSSSFKPMNALDSFNDTFWGEVVLTDEEASTLYNDNSYRGVVVEALITFAQDELFNSVEVLPFGFFPLSVIDIQTSSDGITFQQWAGFQSHDASLDWFAYKAVPVSARYVKIVLHQENHTPANYLIPKQVYDRAHVWEHIMDNTLTYIAANTELLPQDEQSRIADKEFNALIDAQKSLDRESLERDLASGSTMPEMSYRQRGDAIRSSMVEGANFGDGVVQQLPGTALPANKAGFIEVNKLEYVLGAYTLKIGYTEYLPAAEYVSAQYATQGLPLKVALDATEDQQSMSLASGDRRVTSIEYTIQVATNKSKAVVPRGVTRVESEYLAINPQTMQGGTRFTPATVPNEAVSIYGNPLTSADYTLAADGGITLAGYVMHLRAHRAVFTISYDIAEGQDELDIEELNSTALEAPLTATSTDSRGLMRLPYHPYVIMDIINSDDVWDRPNKLEGIWYPRRSAGIQQVDGRWFGVAHGLCRQMTPMGDIWTLTLFDSDGDPAKAEDLGFPDSGYVIVNENKAFYHRLIGAGNSMEFDNTNGDAFGVDGTDPLGMGNWCPWGGPYSLIEFVAEPYYEPIIIHVNGVKAKNITDYRKRHHPAFARVTDSSLECQYIHVGRNIYFNKAIRDADITIDFRYLAAYLQLQALLRCTAPGKSTVTPVIHDYRMLIQTARHYANESASSRT